MLWNNPRLHIFPKWFGAKARKEKPNIGRGIVIVILVIILIIILILILFIIINNLTLIHKYNWINGTLFVPFCHE